MATRAKYTEVVTLYVTKLRVAWETLPPDAALDEQGHERPTPDDTVRFISYCYTLTKELDTITLVVRLVLHHQLAVKKGAKLAEPSLREKVFGGDDSSRGKPTGSCRRISLG